MTFLIALIAFFGHVAICIAAINRMHGVGLRMPALRLCDVVWYSFALGVPLAIANLYLDGEFEGRSSTSWTWLATTYLWVASGAAVIALVVRVAWVWQRSKPTRLLVSNQREDLSVEDKIGHRPTGDLLTTCLASIPGNQIMDLSIHFKQLCLPRLDPALDGLSITHLSDLHFTGQITKPFFAEVVRQSNQLNSDMVVVTGDIIDKRRCIEWIPEILGKLQSRLGVYFVLGNHDMRVRDEDLVRRVLTEAGLIDMGRGAVKLIEHANRPIVLGGNELPWHGPASDLTTAPLEHNGFRPLRIVLCHTPDKLNWARTQDADLMLAGHTHGGQVRFPWIGPILSPSICGVRHASGTFMHPPTLLHVSRGISGTRPLRINCAPELTKLILQVAETDHPTRLQDEPLARSGRQPIKMH